MDPKVVALIGVGLRIFIFLCLLIALVVIATDKLALIDGFKATFNDVQGYRFAALPINLIYNSNHYKFTTRSFVSSYCSCNAMQVRIVCCNYRVGPYNFTTGFLYIPCDYPKHTLLEWASTIQLLRRPGW